MCVSRQLSWDPNTWKRLMQINADQILVEEFGPVIERWVARDPDNPDALEALAWLMRLRLKVRMADPRTYAGRKLPDSLTRLLQG